jgi:hypothetical protein
MYLSVRRFTWLTAVVCALSSFATSQAARQCSDNDMAGGYGFSFHGTNLDLKVSFVMVGRFETDGKGNIKGTESDSVNGRTTRGPFNGTYTINPNCTGSATLTFEKTNIVSKLDFVLVDDGDDILILDIGAGVLESGEARRQFRKARSNR